MNIDNVEYSTFTGWIDPPPDVLPALDGDVTCDVAVIGGGMGGMATALRLAERGQDVVLLEEQFCGYGASSRSAGQIAGAPGGDLRLLSLFSPKKMPGMVRIAENSARFVEDLIKTHDIDCDYEANGMVFGAVSYGQMLRVRTQAWIIRRAGGHGKLGTSTELGIPGAFVGGMREGVGGMLNPGKVCRGVRRALLSSSARVFEQTKVTDVRRTGGSAVISTPHGEAVPPGCAEDRRPTRSADWPPVRNHVMSQALAHPSRPPLGRGSHVATPAQLSPARCASEYRSTCGLPAEVDPATGQVTMRAGDVVGFMVPADLGTRLRSLLDRAGDGGGPIVAHTRSQSWTFLAQRDSSTEEIRDRTRSWWRDRVSALTANTVIGLPCPVTIVAQRRIWIVAPHSQLRPTTSTVIAALGHILPKGGA